MRSSAAWLARTSTATSGLVDVATLRGGDRTAAELRRASSSPTVTFDDSLDVSLRRSKESDPKSVVTEPLARDRIPDAALDAIAAILRVLGETAVGDSQAASRLEAWARHILVLASPPGSGDAVCHSRDWAGLSNHVVAYVRDDHAVVSRSIGDLQDAVWLVIERVSQAVLGDAASDANALAQLERLRTAAGRSAAGLKATALETVELVVSLSAELREVGRRVGHQPKSVSR
jgi:hypothetical protein